MKRNLNHTFFKLDATGLSDLSEREKKSTFGGANDNWHLIFSGLLGAALGALLVPFIVEHGIKFFYKGPRNADGSSVISEALNKAVAKNVAERYVQQHKTGLTVGGAAGWGVAGAVMGYYYDKDKQG